MFQYIGIPVALKLRAQNLLDFSQIGLRGLGDGANQIPVMSGKKYAGIKRFLGSDLVELKRLSQIVRRWCAGWKRGHLKENGAGSAVCLITNGQFVGVAADFLEKPVESREMAGNIGRKRQLTV